MATHHWVISLQYPDGRLGCNSGTADVPPGVTRQEVFDDVRAKLAAQHGWGKEENVVMTWSLESNKL